MERLQAIISLIIGIILFTSCGQTRYVPVDRVHTEIRDVIQHRIDSVHLIDSIYVHSHGDTVYQTRWRTMLRERKIIDTVLEVRIDTITRVVEVERPPGFLQRAERNGYRLALLAVVLVMLIRYIRSLWRSKQ